MMADDEAATIAVTAVAAGDEDVDNILAELDEFDKARSLSLLSFRASSARRCSARRDERVPRRQVETSKAAKAQGGTKGKAGSATPLQLALQQVRGQYACPRDAGGWLSHMQRGPRGPLAADVKHDEQLLQFGARVFAWASRLQDASSGWCLWSPRGAWTAETRTVGIRCATGRQRWTCRTIASALGPWGASLWPRHSAARSFKSPQVRVC